MIYDSLDNFIENLPRYMPRCAELAEFLRAAREKSFGELKSMDFPQLDLRFNEYKTKPETEIPFEAHRKLWDLQLVLEGEEMIGAAPLETLTETVPYDEANDRYIIKGCIAAQETLQASKTVNPPYELSYWHFGLSTAQLWRERKGLERNAEWDEIISKLSHLASRDGLYLAAESEPDTYSDIRMYSDHMAVLAAVGVLPQTPQSDPEIMKNTFDWVYDNWNWDKVWNVTLDEMMQIIDTSLERGYTIAWGSDVSEKGFSRTKGIAIIPEADLEGMEGTEAEKWGKLTAREKEAALYTFDKPGKERTITQELRQQGYDNYETTDDHGMQIVGTAVDQKGNRYYKVKNSWNVTGPYDGYWYFSRPFVAYKTMTVLVNRNAVPKEILRKILGCSVSHGRVFLGAGAGVLPVSSASSVAQASWGSLSSRKKCAPSPAVMLRSKPMRRSMVYGVSYISSMAPTRMLCRPSSRSSMASSRALSKLSARCT